MTVMGISGKELDIQRTFNEENFKKKLKENKSNAGWLTLFEKQDVQELTVPELITVIFMYNDSVDLENEEVKQSYHCLSFYFPKHIWQTICYWSGYCEYRKIDAWTKQKQAVVWSTVTWSLKNTKSSQYTITWKSQSILFW